MESPKDPVSQFEGDAPVAQPPTESQSDYDAPAAQPPTEPQSSHDAPAAQPPTEPQSSHDAPKAPSLKRTRAASSPSPPETKSLPRLVFKKPKTESVEEQLAQTQQLLRDVKKRLVQERERREALEEKVSELLWFRNTQLELAQARHRTEMETLKTMHVSLLEEQHDRSNREVTFYQNQAAQVQRLHAQQVQDLIQMHEDELKQQQDVFHLTLADAQDRVDALRSLYRQNLQTMVGKFEERMKFLLESVRINLAAQVDAAYIEDDDDEERKAWWELNGDESKDGNEDGSAGG